MDIEIWVRKTRPRMAGVNEPQRPWLAGLSVDGTSYYLIDPQESRRDALLELGGGLESVIKKIESTYLHEVARCVKSKEGG